MANITKNTLDALNTIFVLTSMDLPREGAYAIIIIALPAYIFSVVCNLLLIGTVVSNRTLHEPMYILLCNLSFNDIVGISALVPRTVFDIMFDYGLITFPACFLQAWCLHTYGGATVLILSVMAFDRYVAICHPLRYHTIMSKATLIHLISSTWFLAFFVCAVLFGITLVYPICRKEIPSYYCDNLTMLKLTCAADITVSNIYGLFITAAFHAVGIFSIVFTYACILITCCKSTDSESKSKAWHTCGTHLTVFVIFEMSCAALVLLHRIPSMPNILQKILGLGYVIIPNCINPVIYGLKTKDIRVKVKIFKNRIIGLNNLKMSKHECVKTVSSV
ncbi:olfactory receptor 7G1-like [Colossoma macropomum]|uniref:olfactory receptor 7G1-like n=1 Tax=Colossoma macropomum TaxID=42526 RepID=UPI0018647D9D|nr:olfactory receptor 7G1-like [Colossoma macropomum]